MGRGEQLVIEKETWLYKPCMCSKAMSSQIHALLNFPLSALQRNISPFLCLILSCSPRLTTPWLLIFWLFLLPSVTFMMFFFVGMATFLQNFFFSEAKKKTFCFSYNESLLILRREVEKTQMMTAIVKGQISPCGFASDYMFIWVWSSHDSKPQPRRLHSPNSWSSACHWNRLIADPEDREGKWLFVTKLQSRCGWREFSLLPQSMTDWPVILLMECKLPSSIETSKAPSDVNLL